MSAAASESASASRRKSPGTGSPGVVLVVDDEPLMLRAIRRIVEADGHRCVLASDPAAAAPALADPDLDVVLLDLFIGTASGLEVLDQIKRMRPELEVVMITGHASIESAVGCMRRGAFDYLEKPFGEIHRVRATVARALERRRLVQRNRELEQELRERSGLPDMDLPRVAPGPPLAAGAREDTIELSLDAYEKRAIERALGASRGDAGAAARSLGIGRSTFYRKLSKHGIVPGEVRATVRREPRGVGAPRSIG